MAFTRLLPGRGVAVLLALGACLLMAGCAGSGEAREVPPDQRFGHRYAEAGPDGRQTLTITEPAPGAEFVRHDVTVEEVIARAAPFEDGVEAVPVELLVKGALPNDCLSLHAARQERSGHLLAVVFEMRWPTGAGVDCERLRRPYRFYLPLNGRYEPGDYALTLNGTVYPFTIRRR